MTTTPIKTSQPQVPDNFGRFGKYGGKYVPETLMPVLSYRDYTNFPHIPRFT